MIIIILIIAIIVAVLIMYNGLVKARVRVKQAASGIDVYLKQRFDLIPNLVETVKGYSKHEQTILAEITALRNSYMNQPENLKNAENLNNKMNQLVAVAEAYPDLKASEQYLNLQKTLSKLESQLQAARRIYNSEVAEYNQKLETVPSNIVASLFGFVHADLFEIKEVERQNVKIEL